MLVMVNVGVAQAALRCEWAMHITVAVRGGFTPSTCFLVLWLQALSFPSTHTAPAPDLQPRYFSTKH
jgi:hypothetical protein